MQCGEKTTGAIRDPPTSHLQKEAPQSVDALWDLLSLQLDQARPGWARPGQHAAGPGQARLDQARQSVAPCSSECGAVITGRVSQTLGH